MCTSGCRSLLILSFAVMHELRLEASKLRPKTEFVEIAGLLLAHPQVLLSEGVKVKLNEAS